MGVTCRYHIWAPGGPGAGLGPIEIFLGFGNFEFFFGFLGLEADWRGLES